MLPMNQMPSQPATAAAPEQYIQAAKVGSCHDLVIRQEQNERPGGGGAG